MQNEDNPVGKLEGLKVEETETANSENLVPTPPGQIVRV
jgi:hypothetical protein